MTNKEYPRRTGVQSRVRNSGAYHHGDLRAALIAAARQILEEDGFTALSLRGAARVAGVSQTAPYHHFADKDALLASVATQGFEELARTMEARMRRTRGCIARLRAAGVGYVSFAVANPALFRLMFAGTTRRFSDNATLAAAGQHAYGILETALAEMLPASQRDGNDARIACLTAWSVVHGLAKLFTETDLDPASYGAKDAESLTAKLLAQMGAEKMVAVQPRRRNDSPG
jgi:AcrR family transcriptional regulator